jgi:endonuclease YncB( thermonuclease family)
VRRVRSVIVLLVLFAIAAGLQWMNRRSPHDPVAPERVDEIFTVCGIGSSFACVHDGDSFRLGARKIRVRGIDAPEVGEGAKCESERAKAIVARDALRDLLNQGPFVMTAKPGDVRDQYGRELRNLTRTGKGGKVVDMERGLVVRGLVHEYRGRKTSWCP